MHCTDKRNMQRQNEKRSNYQREITWIISYLFNLLEHHLTFLLNNGTEVDDSRCVLDDRNCNGDETDSLFANRTQHTVHWSAFLTFSKDLLEQERQIKAISCRVDGVLQATTIIAFMKYFGTWQRAITYRFILDASLVVLKLLAMMILKQFSELFISIRSRTKIFVLLKRYPSVLYRILIYAVLALQFVQSALAA